MERLFRSYWFLLILLPFVVTPVVTTYVLLARDDDPDSMSRIQEAYNILEERSVLRDNVDPDVFSAAAINGMLEALGDPYASFLPTPQHVSVESEDISGSIEGIGVEVGLRDGRYTVIAPIKGTPAERAGIKPGDVILEVDGKSTSDMTFLEMIFTIRGPKGTEVEIVILPALTDDPATLKITRDTIPMLSVELDMLGDNEDIAYIELSGYLENTDESLKENIEQAIKQGAVGLILDLRNNPGGLVTTTINIVSQFIDDGIVFYEVNGAGDRKDWKVKSGKVVTDLPMVVLVNEYSASASEITAGALQEHGRATIIGTTTFGKGSVNILRQLSDGSGLFFSIAHWFTPEGVSIEGQGISPDIEVPVPGFQSPPDIDSEQLQRALEYLHNQVKLSK